MMRRLMIVAGSVLVSLVAACSPAADSTGPAPTPSTTEMRVPEAIALLPESVVSDGVLTVGAASGLKPFAYEAEDGEITGADVDLMRSLANRLGLDVEMAVSDLPAVVSGVEAGTYDVGVGGVFDTDERRARVDFVNYLLGGSQWAVVAGSKISPDAPCGLRLSAIATDLQATRDIPELSKKCVQQGEPAVQFIGVTSSDQASDLLLVGETDAFISDAPVIEYAVGLSKGRLAATGDIYDLQVYGLVVAKDETGLSDALQLALQSMIDDGSYARLMGKWGLDKGMITLE